MATRQHKRIEALRAGEVARLSAEWEALLSSFTDEEIAAILEDRPAPLALVDALTALDPILTALDRLGALGEMSARHSPSK